MNLAKLSHLINELADGKPVSQLARKMGVNAGTLRLYARNDGSYPSIETLMAIANYKGIELDELIRLVSDSPRNEKGAHVTAKTVMDSIDRLSIHDQKHITKTLVDRMLAAC